MLFIFPVYNVSVSVLPPAGKGLTSWLLFAMFRCVFATFPMWYPGSVKSLIVSIPDLCHLFILTQFKNHIRLCILLI